MINEFHDDDDDVRLVPTLQAACLTKISTELWNNWNASELLAAAVKNNFRASKSAQERIISEIMQSSLPDGLRLQLATAFCEHEKKLREWAKDLKTFLKNPTEANIHYGIAKAIVTQHGNIDKGRSILNMILESYLRIKFQAFTISIRVCINKKLLKSFLRSRSYTDYWIWLKKMKICTSFMQPHHGYDIIMNFLNLNDLQINELILVETYKNASLQMWNFVLTKLEKNNPEMYSLTLAHSLITKDPDTKRVIQIYEHFDEDLQTKFIKIFGIQLVQLMFNKHEIICVQMFDQVCRYHDTNKCSKLLQHMILCTLIGIVPQSPQTTKVLHMRLKQMLLKLWYQTPNPVKEELLTKPQEYLLTSVIVQNDYHLLSILVTDNTCSQEQKNKLIIEAIARVSGKPLHIEKCLQELPEYYNMEFVKNTLRSMLKECFRAPQSINDYDALTNLVFDCKDSTDEFKRTLFSDKEFVTDALSNLANDEEGGGSVMAFLNWGFNNDSIALKNFIDKYMKSEQWLIELYQKYLCMTQDYCTDFLLSLFLADEEEKTNIKRILRQDRDMVLKVLDQCNSSKHFLRCLFDKQEKKQKCELVEEYFSSESGSKRVYDLLTGQVSIKHFSSYFRYVLPKVIRNMFDFKKNWLVSVKVRDIIREVVRPENFQEYINNYVSNCEVWLPFENERQLKTILETNVRLFELIMDSNTQISEYLQEIKMVHMLAEYQLTAEKYLNVMGSYTSPTSGRYFGYI